MSQALLAHVSFAPGERSRGPSFRAAGVVKTCTFRHIKYLLQWLFLERLRGLDFTMLGRTLESDTSGRFHGYYKTDEAHAREILDFLSPTREMAILDVGCGKGAFLRVASDYPFREVGGIEVSPRLANVARKNFKILGLEDRVRVVNCDALAFEGYKDYDVLYFFNPFKEDVMEAVMEKVSANGGGGSWVILHHPTCPEVVEKYGYERFHALHDPAKGYETFFYHRLDNRV